MGGADTVNSNEEGFPHVQARETINNICQKIKDLSLAPDKEKELIDKLKEALCKEAEAQVLLAEVQGELSAISIYGDKSIN